MTDPNEITSDPKRQNEAHVSGEYDYLIKDDMFARLAMIGGYTIAFRAKRVLDAGCGVGLLRRFLPDNVEYEGFDISPFAIAKAQEIWGTVENTSFSVGDVNEVSLDRMFDVAVWAGVGMGMTSENEEIDLSWSLTIEKLSHAVVPHGNLLVECIDDYTDRVERIMDNFGPITKVGITCDGDSHYRHRSLLILKIL